MILLTGAAGFLGSHIAAHLARGRSKVLLLVRPGGDPRRIRALENAEFVEGDLSDRERMRKIFRDHHPTTVIHAAWGGSSGARNGPEQFENFVNTKYLMELCGEFSCRKVIGIGSQNEYGVHNVRLKEEMAARPHQLYGLYKLSSGLLGTYYAKQFGFDYAWLRLFAAFGPMDHPGYMIPATILSFLDNRAPELTMCRQTWDYLYVRDAAALVGKVVEAQHPFCGIYNLCSGEPVVLRKIVSLIREIMATDIVPNFGGIPLREDGLEFLSGDNTKFRNEFGWINTVPLREALKQTVEWYCHHSRMLVQ